ncbi:hypothetical protein Bca4012_078003 [Brassica carinata]|uniref:Uncharacterized protein n=1 Tax=Brassica carinata TaxID=52824 RepID=A0A8X7U4F8_BRACI|nr:hypothetical protein Bca52824_071873 [Brassica carinata]
MQFCPSGIWDSDHTKTPLGLEMLLINEQGVVIPPGRIDTYLPHLVPGSIYRLTNFYGSKSKIVYRVAEPNRTVRLGFLRIGSDSMGTRNLMRPETVKETFMVLRPEALDPEGILDGNLDEEAEDGNGKSADEKVKKSSDVVESAEV